jgi:hypothetical protein
MTNQEELDLSNARIYGTDLQAPDADRLKGQLKRVYSIMKDGRKRTTYQIGEMANCPAASAHRHLSTLRTQYGAVVEKELIGEGLWNYWITGYTLANVGYDSVKKKIKPIGDKEKFGELMRCTYAYANEDSAANTANLAEANQVWLADFINRIKEKRV